MTDQADRGQDVVATWAEVAGADREPLIVLEGIAGFLDEAGLGRGEVSARPLGGGHSNVTYLIERGEDLFVVRRPPRGPLEASTHNVLREAKILAGLASTPVRVPSVLAVCDSDEAIGAPFYVMNFIGGEVLDISLPPNFDAGTEEMIAAQTVDALVDIHDVGIAEGELATIGRPHGYLERQIRRFADLLERSATRPLPELMKVAGWLRENRPQRSDQTLVHGDYRLGNLMFAAAPTPHVVAVFDWEMATLGDPLADVGYLTAMWAQPDDPDDPMLDLSKVTRSGSFPSRSFLAERYERATGRDLSRLSWYQVLALWKAAIFLEGSYRRYRQGSTKDEYFARLEAGVPALARRALHLTGVASS